MIEVDALVKHSVCYASTIATVPRDKKSDVWDNYL